MGFDDRFDWWRRSAQERNVEYVTNEVMGMNVDKSGTKVESVVLKSGESISCSKVVNASGPSAVLTSRMAGIEIPVEPRKRYSWVFQAENPLDRALPLTIDPSGVHVRQEGENYYQAGGTPNMIPRSITMILRWITVYGRNMCGQYWRQEYLSLKR